MLLYSNVAPRLAFPEKKRNHQQFLRREGISAAQLSPQQEPYDWFLVAVRVPDHRQTYYQNALQPFAPHLILAEPAAPIV